MFKNRSRKIKWYNLFWVRVIGIPLIIFLVYFAATKTVTYYNLQEYLKTEIERLKKENKTLDSLYVEEKKKKDKIRIIRETIDISGEKGRINKIEKELEELRNKPLQKVDALSPERLNEYFKKLFKK